MKYIYGPDVADFLPICDLHPRYFKPPSGTVPNTSCSLWWNWLYSIVIQEYWALAYVEVCQVHDKELILLLILRLFGNIVHCISPHYKTPQETFLSGLRASNTCTSYENLFFRLMDSVNHVTEHAFSVVLPSRRFITKFVADNNTILR